MRFGAVICHIYCMICSKMERWPYSQATASLPRRLRRPLCWLIAWYGPLFLEKRAALPRVPPLRSPPTPRLRPRPSTQPCQAKAIPNVHRRLHFVCSLPDPSGLTLHSSKMLSTTIESHKCTTPTAACRGCRLARHRGSVVFTKNATRTDPVHKGMPRGSD